MADEAIRNEAKEVEQEETTLVRIVEWMDWIPASPSKVVGADLHMTHGLTSFQSLKNERLVELGVSGTGKNYVWEEEESCVACDGNGNLAEEESDIAIECGDCNGKGTITVEHRRGLYAFQAVLAQNTSRELASALQHAQAQPMLEEIARDNAKGGPGHDKRDNLVVVQHGNRENRRGGKGRKKRPR